MKLVQQYNFHRGYFMPNFNMKPRKKTSRKKYSVLWGIGKSGKYKHIREWWVLDSRRELKYSLLLLGYGSD